MQTCHGLGRLQIGLDLAQVSRGKVRDFISARLELEYFQREPAFIADSLQRS